MKKPLACPTGLLISVVQPFNFILCSFCLFFPCPYTRLLQLVAVRSHLVKTHSWIKRISYISQQLGYCSYGLWFSVWAECKCATLDLAFIVDSSESIGSTNFALAKDFIITVIDRLAKDQQVKVSDRQSQSEFGGLPMGRCFCCLHVCVVYPV